MFMQLLSGILLLSIGLLLKILLMSASLRDRSFKKKLKESNFTMLIKTRDLKNARYFRLEDGRFKTKSKDYPDPDMSIIWSDSRTFISTIFRLNPVAIVKGFTEAMTNGGLAMEANIESTMWFMSALREMLGVYKHFFSFSKHS